MFKIHPKVPECMSDEAKGFIMNCFVPNPDDRATAAELLVDTFLRSSPRKKIKAPQESEAKDFLSAGEASLHIKYMLPVFIRHFYLNCFLFPLQIFCCYCTCYDTSVAMKPGKCGKLRFWTHTSKHDLVGFCSWLSAQPVCAHLHPCGGHWFVLGFNRPVLLPGPQEAAVQPQSRWNLGEPTEHQQLPAVS